MLEYAKEIKDGVYDPILVKTLLNLGVYGGLSRFKEVNRAEPLYVRNGQGHWAMNYIVTELKKQLDAYAVDVFLFTRRSWKGAAVVDKSTKSLYVVMRRERFFQVQYDEQQYLRNNPSYAKSLSSVLNNGVPCVQLALPGTDSKPYYGDDVVLKDFNNIVQGRIGENDGYKFFVIVFDVARNFYLMHASMLLLDKNMDYYEDALDEYLVPDAADLTEPLVETNVTRVSEDGDSKVLLKIKETKKIG